VFRKKKKFGRQRSVHVIDPWWIEGMKGRGPPGRDVGTEGNWCLSREGEKKVKSVNFLLNSTKVRLTLPALTGKTQGGDNSSNAGVNENLEGKLLNLTCNISKTLERRQTGRQKRGRSLGQSGSSMWAGGTEQKAGGTDVKECGEIKMFSLGVQEEKPPSDGSADRKKESVGVPGHHITEAILLATTKGKGGGKSTRDQVSGTKLLGVRTVRQINRPRL